ncbi:transmembrane protein, putative (macronuclear) [Tetrahymena thermophila SB210]|uniref:Transmembrane protein, putative n=1 Tax=Tetrahymena thermophila (strain SB210) TaxID=312017 RepID=Q24GQ4_TETTS|nr:transmembrane protein, putative [Tetrahymena thermophila SB210]EAS06953.1 transmembrane protein, putative [Tetrahymena thermophila SB210]|eukprot:XP_001027195.1 transmembrane protein, putative [Tetrahymena thermophila SB210]
MGIKQLIVNLDIFGSPFQFEMGVGNQTRQTMFGGILSIILILAALAYFGYLNYLYGADQLQPKITQTQIRLKNNFAMPFDTTLLWFDIVDTDSGTHLLEYQQQNGVNYITYTAKLQQSDPKTGKRLPDINLPLDFCQNLTKDPSVDAMAQCLNLQNLSSTQSQFQIFSGAGFDTTIVIQMKASCDVSSTDPCNTDTLFAEYDEYVYGETAQFFINFKQSQFDSKQRQIVTKVTDLSWDFDPTLSTSSTVTLSTAKTSVKEGFLIQKQTDYLYLVDANNQDSFKTKGSASKSDPLIIGTFYIKLSHDQYMENVQYAQYPEILAQFGSIVNVLLLIGIIGVVVAKADIQQYFIDQKLKEYYRKTAYKILKEDAQTVNTNPKSPRNSINRNGKVNKNEILKIIKEIDSKDMNEELTKKFKVSTLEKIVRSVKAEQKEDYQKKKRSNKDIYETLFFEATKCQDVFELQSQLMQMKKVLALLLTPEQYAAIKCCGSSIDDQIQFLLERNQQENEKKLKTEKTHKTDKTQKTEENGEKIEVELESQVDMLTKNNLSHIEQIDKVDYDSLYFQAQLEKFFKNSEKDFENENENTKQLNLRVLECLKKTYGSDD